MVEDIVNFQCPYCGYFANTDEFVDDDGEIICPDCGEDVSMEIFGMNL